MSSTVVGTWSFSLDAVSVAKNSLLQSRPALDALESGINCIEENGKYGPCIVGVGGPRNANGYLEMDAGVMVGRTLQFGAVTALQGITRPFSVARAVMERSPHSMLTSDGARIFAEAQGFSVDSKLLSQNLRTERGPSLNPGGHDTLGLIVLDNEDIVCGVSTSGMPGKHPGRVGDSALPGNGLYADSHGGAACCSGDGDFILKFCPAFQVVHHMKHWLYHYSVQIILYGAIFYLVYNIHKESASNSKLMKDLRVLSNSVGHVGWQVDAHRSEMNAIENRLKKNKEERIPSILGKLEALRDMKNKQQTINQNFNDEMRIWKPNMEEQINKLTILNQKLYGSPDNEITRKIRAVGWNAAMKFEAVKEMLHNRIEEARMVLDETSRLLDIKGLPLRVNYEMEYEFH